MIGTTSVRNLSMAVALVVISAFFALHPEGAQFLSPENLSNLSIELAITATLALGMFLVLLPGMIDLSVGSGVGMLGGLAAVLIIDGGLAAPAALVLTTLVALAMWALMGALIVRQKVPSFIITLGGLLVFQGLHWLIIRNATVPVAPGGAENVYSLLTTYYLPAWGGYVLAGLTVAGLAVAAISGRRSRARHGLPVDDAEMTFLKLFCAAQGILLIVVVMNGHKGVPLSLVILGLVLAGVHVLTRFTRFGRYLYAIGGNEEAARLSGIPVGKVVIGAYVLLGAVTALTGFLQTAYGGYSTTTVGKLMELDAIAACVIGGTNLKGGRGTVHGVLFGALIMAVLLNGMTLLAVSPEKKVVARGVVLVLAVWMDVALSRARRTA
jgi:D-xylose transport system permease protein